MTDTAIEKTARLAEGARRGARFVRGARAILPLSLGAVPFGLAYGAVATQTLPLWQGMLMSLTVFAGTAQFLAASMLAHGAGWLPVLATGMLVNLRLLLMGAAMAPHLNGTPRWWRPILAHLLTDETFAVALAEFERRGPDPLYYLGAGASMFVTWQIACIVGLAFGAVIPPGLGLEYALPASLICLLFILVRPGAGLAAALLGAALTPLLYPLVGARWCALAATLLATTAATCWPAHKGDQP